jgi:catabolite repression HPr-like protein
MSLAVSAGASVNLIADGNDEEEALEKLAEYIQKEN